MNTLEICCGDIQSVHAAHAGGANRVELCSALEVGGLTPSAALIKHAVDFGKSQRQKGDDFKVHVLIRPRPGDFVYDDEEISIIVGDIEMAKRLGADAVVVGALDTNGDIDIEAMRLMMQAANGMGVTFHRAFDLCNDPQKAIAQIIELGCDRLLTSGCAPSAQQGIDMLKALQQSHGDKIAIMAGAGVGSSNARAILDQTGLSEIHASARHRIASKMHFQRDSVSMGAPGSDEYSRLTTSAEIVKQIRKAIDQ